MILKRYQSGDEHAMGKTERETSDQKPETTVGTNQHSPFQSASNLLCFAYYPGFNRHHHQQQQRQPQHI
jgi:hypothetical protein